MINVVFKDPQGIVLGHFILPVVPRKGEVVRLPDRPAHIKERVREVEYKINPFHATITYVTIDQYFAG